MTTVAEPEPSTEHSPRTEARARDTVSARPPSLAWTLLFGSLTASAGHGLFLAFAITDGFRGWPSLHDLGNGLAPLTLWFLASIPGALALVLLRRRVSAWSAGRLRLAAAVTTALTIVVFAAYFGVLTRS